MYGKLEITGTIEVLTGLHIGGSNVFAAIGAVDSPVIKDSLTGSPMIPGSSLKGKMRTLLARKYNEIVSGKPDDDAPEIKRLFGSSKNPIQVGKVLFSDTIMNNWDELKNKGLDSKTEVKFENNINRLTGKATPRQIERVPRGVEFPLSLIYEITAKDTEDEILKDMELLSDGLKLLTYDYLGGSGSRGYGRIKFSNVTINNVIGDANSELVSKCQEILSR